MTLVGLYGPSRCGKDSVASVLVEDFGFEQRAMAGRIREILLGLDPWLMDTDGVFHTLSGLYRASDGDWDLIKARAPEAVDLMIRLGQTCRDVLGEGVWLDSVMPADHEQKVCISDCRQPNEYEAIKDLGGRIWKITRPDVVHRGMDGLLDDLQFDAHIDNCGTLKDLRSLVQATVVADLNASAVRDTGHGR